MRFVLAFFIGYSAMTACGSFSLAAFWGKYKR